MTAPRPVAEVVVVGGGILGACVAYQLGRLGVRDVTLLERRRLGAGATGRSAALVREHHTNVTEARLAVESLRIFRGWSEAVGRGTCGFYPAGFVYVVAPEDEAHLRANVAAQRACGAETRIVSAAELAEIVPLLRTDDLTYVAFEAQSGYVDPNATLRGFADAAVAGGAVVCEGVEVRAIHVEAGRVCGVETTSGRVSTRTVIVAAGAFSDRLLRPLGIDLGMTPIRVQLALLRGVDSSHRLPALIDGIHHAWMRRYGVSDVLVGVERRPLRVDPDTYTEGLDPGYGDASRIAVAARIPALAAVKTSGGWAGVVMLSPDRKPIVDHVPSIEGCYLATGDSGTSFKTAPALGICIAQMVVEGTSRLVDLTPFRATRFTERVSHLDEHRYGRHQSWAMPPGS